MNEWKEYKLGEVCEITSSKRIFCSEYVSTGVPFYRSKEVIDLYNNRNISTELFISENRYKEIETTFGVPMPNDILLTSVGSLGIPYQVKKGDRFYFKDGNLTWLRKINKDILCSDYFMQWICSDLGKHKLDEITIGSTQQALTISGLKTINILLPHLTEQELIAGILSSLDDKIDLLGRQNATLEAMAETLFRQYFIESPKEDWKDGVIGDIAKHSKIAIHPQKQPTELFCHYSIPSFDNAKTPTLDLGVDIQSSKYKVPNNSILFSKLNPHKGKRVWLLLNCVHDNSVCSTEFQIIEPINQEYLYFVYGWLTYSENYNDIAYGVGGTSGSHQRIDPVTIFSFTCPIIDLDYIRLYNSQVKPMFEKQINNQQQIRSLTKLRDTLLPKLMNNEIKI